MGSISLLSAQYAAERPWREQSLRANFVTIKLINFSEYVFSSPIKYPCYVLKADGTYTPYYRKTLMKVLLVAIWVLFGVYVQDLWKVETALLAVKVLNRVAWRGAQIKSAVDPNNAPKELLGGPVIEEYVGEGSDEGSSNVGAGYQGGEDGAASTGRGNAASSNSGIDQPAGDSASATRTGQPMGPPRRLARSKQSGRTPNPPPPTRNRNGTPRVQTPSAAELGPPQNLVINVGASNNGNQQPASNGGIMASVMSMGRSARGLFSSAVRIGEDGLPMDEE